MSLYFLQSLLEIWESPNTDKARVRIGATRKFGGKYSMASWGERGAFGGKRGKRNKVALGTGPSSLLEP